jgi:hypothetical protein
VSYEIKIGQRSIAITDNVSEVVAPNEQMAILFKGMNIFGDLRAVAMLAEAEADAVEVIRNDPDLNEAAKTAGPEMRQIETHSRLSLEVRR